MDIWVIGNSADNQLQPDHKLTIEVVQETWAETLGLTRFGPHDDFFEMGGSSLMVATAVARLGERLRIELPLRALFAAPTPAEMAELITELRSAGDHGPSEGTTPFFPDWVIPLQGEGTGRPVFVFPAGHHGLMALAIEAQVAAHVGRDHPFWGFGREDPQLDRPRMDGVTTLVAEYVAQMKIIQGKGPFLLYGNCVGGYLAWEAARQLLELGEEIAGLLFYEVPLRPDLARQLPDDHPAHPTNERRLSQSYRPRALPIDLTHLMTKGWHARDWGTPWQQVALGSVETVIIPGETETAFERREERIARHVREWIATAETRIRGS